jgi:uncharacterized protein
MSAAVFADRSKFQPEGKYRLLPFHFDRIRDDQYLLTNLVGEYVIVSRAQLEALVAQTMDTQSPEYQRLKTKHFLADCGARSAIDLLALKYRTREAAVSTFTGLHIFVVTLRCDHSCHYCQVSRQPEQRAAFDMTQEHAERALQLVFRSPSPHLKIEFQGGEPLLNFPLIEYIVTRAKAMNELHRRQLAFVIASNLSRLSDGVLAFCKHHDIVLSTSLDGPADLHDSQRPARFGSSYQQTVQSIQRARQVLGPGSVAALMTTTPSSLKRITEVIDEYVHLGFHSIFLRSISPYGFATRQSLNRRYSAHDWIASYQRGLAHILDINRRGYPLREEYATILLQKILTARGASYVDLQSPAGLGIGALVYNYDGLVYASDEGRMLAEMGDTSFRLGHVEHDSYESMLTSPALLSTLLATMPEGVPMCSDCAYQPYCGADPAFHRATQGDEVGHKALSSFCEKQIAVLKHLIDLLENDAAAREILTSWVEPIACWSS